MADLTSAIIGSSASGFAAGNARAARQDANNSANSAWAWKREHDKVDAKYKELVAKYNGLIEDYKTLAKNRDDHREKMNEYADIIDNLNTAVEAATSDRVKAYEFIDQMSEVIREVSPNHSILTNPNAVVAEINYFSADYMKRFAEAIRADAASTNPTTYSLDHSLTKANLIAQSRSERGDSYKSLAEKGVTSLDRNLSPAIEDI